MFTFHRGIGNLDIIVGNIAYSQDPQIVRELALKALDFARRENITDIKITVAGLSDPMDKVDPVAPGAMK